MPSRKNGYKPPVCTDERLRYINVECGECYECKRKRARQWRIRMSEEIRELNKKVIDGEKAKEQLRKCRIRFEDLVADRAMLKGGQTDERL